MARTEGKVVVIVQMAECCLDNAQRMSAIRDVDFNLFPAGSAFLGSALSFSASIGTVHNTMGQALAVSVVKQRGESREYRIDGARLP